MRSLVRELRVDVTCRGESDGALTGKVSPVLRVRGPGQCQGYWRTPWVL